MHNSLIAGHTALVYSVPKPELGFGLEYFQLRLLASLGIPKDYLYHGVEHIKSMSSPRSHRLDGPLGTSAHNNRCNTPSSSQRGDGLVDDGGCPVGNHPSQ